MKSPFKISPPSFKSPSFKLPSFQSPSFDAQAINETIRSKLAAAGLDTTSGPMRGVTDTIRHALTSASVLPTQSVAVANEDIINFVTRPVDRAPQSELARPQSRVKSPLLVGTFKVHEYANRAGTRRYKLYVPAQIAAAPPLIVMLHGCTQSADDFAAGTRMNQLADQHGFLVAYPEQSSSANPSKCWSWFKAQDQVRDCGEPSLIVGIVHEVAARYHVDPHQIYVAGMSAGAAMAVILGETYPEVFAAIGVHSGLPYRSANDIPSAMLAMKGGRSGIPGLQTKPDLKLKPGLKAKSSVASSRNTSLRHAVPTIVFHGDQDHTVQHSNAIEIIRQAMNACALDEANVTLHVNTIGGTASNGRSYTRTFYVDAAGTNRIEFWSVHAAGHTWSGGDARGSYTDASGPDASVEMLRFFRSVRCASSR